MAHQAKMVPSLRLTYITYAGQKCTRVFRNADSAAEFYALISSQDWWCDHGFKDTDPTRRKERRREREARTLRRVLPIFQRVLP